MERARAVMLHPGVRQFTKFALVGLVNTAVHFSVYFMLTRFAGLSVAASNPLAFLVAVTVSFLLNRRWTFRVTTGDHRVQYARFFAVNVVGLGINETVLLSLHQVFGLHDLVAFVFAVGSAMLWNFFATRHWTFRGHIQD